MKFFGSIFTNGKKSLWMIRQHMSGSLATCGWFTGYMWLAHWQHVATYVWLTGYICLVHWLHMSGWLSTYVWLTGYIWLAHWLHMAGSLARYVWLTGYICLASVQEDVFLYLPYNITLCSLNGKLKPNLYIIRQLKEYRPLYVVWIRISNHTAEYRGVKLVICCVCIEMICVVSTLKVRVSSCLVTVWKSVIHGWIYWTGPSAIS